MRRPALSQTAEAHGHMGRLEPARLNRTENFVRFQGPRAERSDGFSRKCAILFRTSHPAAARFRRSFRISVCKTSLLTSGGRDSDVIRRSPYLPLKPRSAGEPCTVQRKIWAAADFQNFPARPRRPRKKRG